MIDLEEIKSRINPQYADRRGSESHESKMLCDEIEALRRQLADSEAERMEQARLLGMSGEREAGLLAKLAEKDAEIERLKAENRDACIGLNDYFGQQLEIAEACLAGDNALIIGLKNDIAEKDAVIGRLQFALADTEALELGTAERLAASQLREQQLRDVLHKLACLGNGAHYGTSDGNRIAQVALALSSDTTALETMIVKAGEVMRDRVIKVAGWSNTDGVEAGLRAIPGVTLEDLK